MLFSYDFGRFRILQQQDQITNASVYTGVIGIAALLFVSSVAFFIVTSFVAIAFGENIIAEIVLKVCLAKWTQKLLPS